MLNYSIPGNTQRFNFYDNLITHVPAGYFKNTPILVQIRIYRNEISDVDDCAFANVPSVVHIHMGNNKLSLIRKNMFRGLPNLGFLSLEDNEIHTIEDGSFKDYPLIFLSLSENSLESIPQCMFNPQNYPTGLDGPYSFYIYDNPLSCNESLCWLKQENMTGIKVDTDYQMPVCSEPGALSGRAWDTLTTEDLNCGNMTTLDPCNTTGKGAFGT